LALVHLYFWKSTKWLHGIDVLRTNNTGFRKMNGDQLRGTHEPRNAIRKIDPRSRQPGMRAASL
jgi:DMSO/TMAO reductase YedYZ molybdopterin-dependent catalytic subunit